MNESEGAVHAEKELSREVLAPAMLMSITLAYAMCIRPVMSPF